MFLFVVANYLLSDFHHYFLFFFFLMIRPPPRSPLFPSTPLFRSENQSLPEPPATEVVNSAINLFAISLPLQPPKVQESILEQIATFLAANSLQRDPGRKDRKSTRLNSSHLVISYAVFCLKKKKTT